MTSITNLAYLIMAKENKVNIHIVGVTQASDLVGHALHAVQQSSAIIGSPRQLAIVKPHLATRSVINLHELPKLAKLDSLIDELALKNQDKSIAVLASGDPLHYGIGRWFTKHFSTEHLVFHPAISSIQMACHRLALSLQDVTVHSVHGRPLASLRTKLTNAKTLVLLTDKNSQPHALAKECIATGYGQSSITVLENLSYPQERVRVFRVDELLAQPELEFEPLHVSVITVRKDLENNKTCFLPQFPGIPDTSYITGQEAGKGMITKREVRLCILSLLQPSNHDTIWDIGAGCGGVAVELSYWNDKAQVYAIECHPERLMYLQANQQRFGVVQNLHIINGTAPECLSELPQPNKIFIGGSGGNMSDLLDKTWNLLPLGGILVASAVITNTKQVLLDFAKRLKLNKTAEIEIVEVSVKRGQLIDAKLDYTAKLPVEVFKLTKRADR